MAQWRNVGVTPKGPMTMTMCRRLFREIDRCRKDDGSIDARDWPLIWENSGLKEKGYSLNQMTQKVYRLKTRNNVSTLQTYEDFVCSQARHSKRFAVPRSSRNRLNRMGWNQQTPRPLLASCQSMTILDAEKPLLKNLARIAQVVTGHILYSVELWSYLGGSGVVSYARFRKLVVHSEFFRAASLLQETIPPVTEQAAKSTADSMVKLRARFGVIFDPDTQTVPLAPVSRNVSVVSQEDSTTTLPAASLMNASSRTVGVESRSRSGGYRKRLSNQQWIQILETDSRCDRLTNKKPKDWEELVSRLGILTARTGRELMEDFYSSVAPRIRQFQFGLPGMDVTMELEPAHAYAMTVVYHAVEDWSIDGIRIAIDNLLKSRILDWNTQNSCNFWCSLLWQNLYSKNAEYFCTDAADFDAFKTSVFGTLLPNVISM